MEDEPEFLELSARQRRAVDRAFERGLRSARGRPSKRRRLTSGPTGTATPDDGGGFVPDEGGGFVPDDGGGFVPEDGGGFGADDDAGGFIPDDDAGGFIPDDSGSAGPSATPAGLSTRSRAPSTDSDERLPLRLMPALLSTLGLPSDEDVLGVFRAMGEGGVARKDFRAVCAALMPPDGEDDGDDDRDQSEEGEDWEMSSGSGSDAFEPSDDSDFAPRKGKAKTRAALQDTGAARLSPRQREGARALWALIKPDARGILSRDEVKRWARELGEMWSDAEITDMVTLFSGQHEGRGLTFEDFGVVMLRAGLV